MGTTAVHGSNKLIGDCGSMLVSSTNSKVECKFKVLSRDDAEPSFLRFLAPVKYTLESLRAPSMNQKVCFTTHQIYYHLVLRSEL